MVNTSSGVIGWFIEKKHNISKHFSLSEANERIMTENAQLHAMMPESFYKLQGDIYNIDGNLFERQYEYYSSEVINSSTTKRNNTITLSTGTNQGIREGMGVINDEGVVGFVMSASPRYAIVKTLLSENANIGVKLKKNNEHWYIKWDGTDENIAQIKGVTRDIDIEVGDTIVTRGSAGMFPEGKMVGIVTKLIPIDGKSTLNVDIRLSVNFRSVYHVYVIKNNFAEEQKELEGRFLDVDE